MANDFGAGYVIGQGQANAYFVSPLRSVEMSWGIILLHDSQGYHSQDSVTFADKLAEQGYNVLIPSFHNDVQPLQEHFCTPSHEQPSDKTSCFQILLDCVDFLRRVQQVSKLAYIGCGKGGNLPGVCLSQLPFCDSLVLLYPTYNLDDLLKVQCPSLLLFAEKDALVPIEKARDFLLLAESNAHIESKIFPGQIHGFAHRCIDDENSAVQAVATIIDFLAIHLKKVIPDVTELKGVDPWWPEGHQGQFLNVGLQNWHQIRTQWRVQTQERPLPPSPPPIEVVLEGLASMRRTFDLPKPMPLPDVVEIFVDIWELNKDE